MYHYPRKWLGGDERALQHNASTSQVQSILSYFFYAAAKNRQRILVFW
jgi:hypothetical protein